MKKFNSSSKVFILIAVALVAICSIFVISSRTSNPNEKVYFEKTYNDNSIPGGKIDVKAGWIESMQGNYITINETRFTSAVDAEPSFKSYCIEVYEDDFKKLKDTLDSLDSEDEKYHYLSFMLKQGTFYGSKEEYEKAFDEWYEAEEAKDEAEYEQYLKEQEVEKARQEKESAKARKETDEKNAVRQAEKVSDQDAALDVFDEIFASEEYLSTESIAKRTEMVRNILDDWKDSGTFESIDYSYNPNENHFIIHNTIDKTTIYFILDIENNQILTNF